VSSDSDPTLPGTRFRGPYLGAAVLCEKVLNERDGVLSVIRMIDRITITAHGDAVREMPAGIVNLNLYVMFKSGDARGAYQIGVRTVSPSGPVVSTVQFPMLMEGEDRGAALVAQITLEVREEGVYWFEVLLEDTLITRVPLRVLWQRMVFSLNRPES
jgi:hypothetical protein